MTEGWIKVHRKILSNGLWKKPMDFRLFFCLVVNAVFDEVQYDDIIIKRGQYLRSYRQLQEDLSYIQNNRLIIPSLSALKRSIEHLIELKMIETLETKLGTLFNIVNYEKYQSESDYLEPEQNEVGTKLGTQLGTPTEQQRNNNKKDKKEKNDKNHDAQGSFNNPSQEKPDQKIVTTVEHYKKEEVQYYLIRPANDKDVNQFNLLATKYGKDVCDMVLKMRSRKNDGTISKVFDTRKLFGSNEKETMEIFENATMELAMQRNLEDDVKRKREDKSKQVAESVYDLLSPVAKSMDLNICANDGCVKSAGQLYADDEGNKFCSFNCYEKFQNRKVKTEEYERLPV